ncbi:MAG: copper amine oxidase N-terminal domain-containing protein [Bacillota bacterium]
MKKTVMLLTILLLLMVFSGTAYADTEQRVVVLKIGDSQALIDNQPVQLLSPAVVVDGRTLVPLRFVGEAFGCAVDWNGETQTAAVSLEEQNVEVTIGKSKARVNGEETALQVPAQLINGRTFVPLRFVGESLGADISWDGNEQKITIKMLAYYSEQLKLKVIIPSGWELDEETNENISFKISNIAYCTIQKLNVKKEGINKDNFNLFASELLKEYETKNKIGDLKADNMIGIMYKEDELINIYTIKLLEDDSFAVIAGYPETGINATLLGKLDILLNTLSDY